VIELPKNKDNLPNSFDT